jgi:hypothetical protein
METLINDIRTKTKKSFAAKTDTKGKPYKNVANYGAKAGCLLKNIKNGEYNGIVLSPKSDIKPLLTNFRMIKCIKALIKKDYESAVAILHLTDLVAKDGICLLYHVIYTWLTKNELSIPNEIISELGEYENTDLNVLTTRSDPILNPIIIIEIGLSKTGTPVVPKSWLNREFKDGVAMHSEMDNLETRVGKPPVNYCCIYSLTVLEPSFWQPFTIDIIGKKIYAGKEGCKYINDNELNKYQKNKCQYVIKNDYILIVDPTIFRKEQSFIESENVGILVSRMQKSIRNGPKCANLLEETIQKLSKSRPYSLPEQQYVQVSGSKQMVWRLFISIIEDSEPLLIQDETCFTLFDLLCFALILEVSPKLQLIDEIVQKIIFTALVYQDTTNNWNWRNSPTDSKEKENNKSLISTLEFGLSNFLMMKGDREMLTKSIKFLESHKVTIVDKTNTLQNYLKKSDEKQIREAKLVSYDMHCKPNIIIDVMASLPFINTNITTKMISSMIWEYSSKYNYREPKQGAEKLAQTLVIKQVVETLRKEQEKYLNRDEYLLVNGKKIRKFDKSKFDPPTFVKTKTTNLKIENKLASRVSFLLFFGKTLNIGKYSVIPDEKDGIKIKSRGEVIKSTDKNYLDIKNKYYAHYNNLKVKLPDPPENYSWLNCKPNDLVTLNIKEGNYYVNNILCKPFDCYCLLKPISVTEGLSIKCVDDYVDYLLYMKKECGKPNINFCNPTNWHERVINCKIPIVVWHIVYTRISLSSDVEFGPVDRRGNKIQNAIDWIHEGTALRVMLALQVLYPKLIVSKNKYKFKIDTNNSSRTHLIWSLKKILGLHVSEKSEVSNTQNITIKSKLWDHQQELSNRIINDIKSISRRGFGDASGVGAGKTLSALHVISEISKFEGQHYFLVLLPVEKLYKTWSDEIEKHCSNYNFCIQTPNGKLNKELSSGSILITTLGRFRDHPVRKVWSFVIVDECLSIQNSGALQTMNALNAIMVSKYGTLMMSATFFRSRFDKLFYLLQMLSTGLPLNAKYLDSILNESIKAYLPENGRTWTTEIERYPLKSELRKKYDKIKTMGKSSEVTFIELSKLLYDEFNYIECYKNTILKVEKLGKKCLIYGSNKEEVDKISALPNVSKYPDITNKHVVITIHAGAYGLNDLIGFNCIVCKPPYNDILPQMKGRLDRPGQKSNDLLIYYIIAENTVEEGLLVKMQIANNFYKDYILPLSKYYKLAIKY